MVRLYPEDKYLESFKKLYDCPAVNNYLEELSELRELAEDREAEMELELAEKLGFTDVYDLIQYLNHINYVESDKKEEKDEVQDEDEQKSHDEQDSPEEYIAPARYNMCKTEQDYLIELEIPHFSKQDIGIEIVNGMLEVQGEKPEDYDEGVEYLTKQFGELKFLNKFKLDELVDVNEISSFLSKGVLTIVLPLKEEEDNITIVTID